MKSWTCTITAKNGALVSEDARLRHAQKYLQEICGLNLSDVVEVQTTGTSQTKGQVQNGAFPWEQGQAGSEVR